MKKLIALLSAFALVFSLSACGQKADGDDMENTTNNNAVTEETTEEYAGGLADDGAQVLKIEGEDYSISLVEPATYWHQDVDTMVYNTDADDSSGIMVWAKDSAIEDSTVCIQGVRDQTYMGTAEERTKGEEFDCTFETATVGEYTLYHGFARESSDGYKEEHMFVDFNGCTLSIYGCYYNFETFCEFLEATLAKIQVEKVENN